MRSLLISLFLLLNVYANDAVKGQTYYLYILKDKLGYNGAVFAKQHTKAQWQSLFQNKAQGLKTVLIQENKQLESFLNSAKFEKISPYLQAFVQHYAKDVHRSPSCN